MSLNYFKSITKRTYSRIASDYAKRDRRKFVDEWPEVRSDGKKFVELLPKKAKVLDIGCGAGRDTMFLTKRGLNVVGIDFSENMIEAAKKLNQRVDYRVMDFEKMNFQKEEFDGVWANASLHHIPTDRLRKVLRNIYKILKEKGIFFIKVKQGVFQGIRENKKFGKSIKRYFRFYRAEEMEKLLKSAGFKIILKKVTNNDEWIDIFCEKIAQ